MSFKPGDSICFVLPSAGDVSESISLGPVSVPEPSCWIALLGIVGSMGGITAALWAATGGRAATSRVRRRTVWHQTVLIEFAPPKRRLAAPLGTRLRMRVFAAEMLLGSAIAYLFMPP
jgi:hypothetical protein